MKKWIAGILVFVLCMGLIIYGQRTVGIKQLGLMVVGLGGILGMLYFYNRGYNG